MLLESMKGTILCEEVDVFTLPQVLRESVQGLAGLHRLYYVHFDIRPGRYNKRIFYTHMKALTWPRV